MRILSDDVIAALNIWIEARGEEQNGKIAVGEVMLNRQKTGQWGKTIAEVVLAPYQFSGWNTNDHNRIYAALLDDADPQYVQCAQAWALAKSGTSYAKGAVRYFNPDVVARPPWATANLFIVRIGHHEFYR